MSADTDEVVWWTDFCGNRSQYDAFWSPAVTLETASPDLTLCFQKTVLLWVPAAWLWLAAPLYLHSLTNQPTNHSFCAYSKLNFIKTLCGVLLVVVAVLALIGTINDISTSDDQVPTVNLTFDIVRILTLILATCLMRWEYQKGVHTSGVLCVFWALYFISQIVTIRSAAMRRATLSAWMESEAKFGIDVTFFVLLAIEFLSSLFADLTALDPKPTKSVGEKQPLLEKTTEGIYPQDGKPLPELTASFWNKTTFQWMLPSVVRGYRKTVTFDDLFDVRPEDRCGFTMPIFFGTYNQSVHKSPGGRLGNVRAAFWKALFNTVGWPLLLGLMLKYLSVALFLANPQLLRLLLQTIETEGDEEYSWRSTALAVAIFLTALCGSVVRHNFFYIGWNTGLKARSVVNAVVCRKALRLGGASKRSTTVGEMVNFLSVDGQKIQDMFTFGHLILDVPIQLTATCALMWTTIGWSTSAGLALLLVVVPLNGFFFGNTVRKLQGKQMIHKDSRLRIINEILNGIKILKLYAWEESFSSQVRSSREEEIRYIKYANIMSAISHTMWCILPYLTSLAIFAVFTLTSDSHLLTADTAFVTLSYINTLQFPLANLPLGVNFLGQGIVSGNRIARFLELDELRQDSVEQNPSTSDAVRIDDGTFCWEPDGRPILEDINLCVKPGQLVAIVGHVGAGKSSLLSTILGEMVKAQGSVAINGTVAYVPQQAWIRNATVKNNILFSKPHDASKYSGVLDACSLTQDLTILPGGDLTEIGERGINLSGGQKQRVSLARAIYQDEDIYLLDDPLSAVDAHVGKHIFDNVLGEKGLLKNKTRILVTHAITFLAQVDLIVVVTGGHVTEMGQYEELLENDGAFAEFLRTYLVEHEDDASSGTDFAELRRQLSTDSEKDSSTKLKRRGRSQSSGSYKVSTGPDSTRPDPGSKIVQKSTLIQEETSAEGRLKMNVIKQYVRAGGIMPFVIVLCSQILFVAGQVATNLWLSDWTNDRPVNGTISQEHINYRLTVYGVFGIVQAVSALSLMTTAAMGCTYASRNLHASLLYRILRAPMAFFDTTPLGRIMNRFSKDLDMIDANVPLYLRSWLFATGPLISTVVLVSYTTPFFIVVLVILGVPFVFTQRAYIIYASQLKRIDAVRRSPIYAHFDETVAGATSIRAYRRQGAFIAEADHLIDNSQKPYSLMSSVQRWLGVTMETMGSLVILCATLFAVAQKDSIGAGLAGVSITYALQITTLLNTMIRSSTELETYMISVERIDEYSNVDMEAPWELADDQVPQEWPQEGAVTFNQYGTRYRPGLDLVLNKVNLDIHPTEKIGVVGRTGAGKSSLTLALFRIIESAEGNITIDGQDISTVGLHKLRARLTVIPQDPVMFVGSMRFNLDPFGLYTDHEIWESLEHAHLKDFVESLDEGLEYECGEGGDALSVGQRQLVCLARALLRRSMVLVLDEATAAVDLETDALIQVSIRKHFKQCTVITVAHRLNTVLDHDRILVLDHGRVKEFDSPANLLANKKSIFYSLAKEAGLT